MVSHSQIMNCALGFACLLVGKMSSEVIMLVAPMWGFVLEISIYFKFVMLLNLKKKEMGHVILSGKLDVFLNF